MLIGKMESFLNEAKSLVGEQEVVKDGSSDDESELVGSSDDNMKMDMKTEVEPDVANKKALIIAMMKKKGMA